MKTSVKLEAKAPKFDPETGAVTKQWVNNYNNPILGNLVNEYRERVKNGGSWKGFGNAIPSQFTNVNWSFLYTDIEDGEGQIKRLSLLLDDMGWTQKPSEPVACRDFTDKRTGELITGAYSVKVHRDPLEGGLSF